MDVVHREHAHCGRGLSLKETSWFSKLACKPIGCICKPNGASCKSARLELNLKSNTQVCARVWTGRHSCCTSDLCLLALIRHLCLAEVASLLCQAAVRAKCLTWLLGALARTHSRMASTDAQDAEHSRSAEAEAGPGPASEPDVGPSVEAANGKAGAAHAEHPRDGPLAAIAEEEEGGGEEDMVGPELPKAKRRKARRGRALLRPTLPASRNSHSSLCCCRSWACHAPRAGKGGAPGCCTAGCPAPRAVCAPSRPPERLRAPAQVLEHEHMYLDALPCAEMYERSYMHRDAVTHVAVAPETDFFVTGSADGHLKFWKKRAEGVEFAKHFRAHLGGVDGAPLRPPPGRPAVRPAQRRSCAVLAPATGGGT